MGDDLAEAQHAARRHRTDATLWAARAEAADDPVEAQQLREDAAVARLRADDQERVVDQLDEADTARVAWYLHTVVSRDKCERGRAALAARGVDVDDPQEQVTAEEWLQARRDGEAVEEQHREITDADVLEDVSDRHLVGDEPVRDDEPVTETAVPDVREVSVEPVNERRDREPDDARTQEHTAALIARAQAALAEIADRHAADLVRTADDADSDERREELARWAEIDSARHDDLGSAAVLD